jgi:hypothetical protein
VSEINNKFQIDNLNNDIKFVRYSYRLLSITPLFIIIFLLTFILADFFPSMMSVNLNSNFHRMITIIAPNITDQEIKKLKASWASMKNYQDYKSINTELEKIAKENNITY